MPNYKCPLCAKFVSFSDNAKCTKCGRIFHPDCAKGYDPKCQNWLCHTCTTPPAALKTTNAAYKSPGSPGVTFMDASATSSPSSLTEEMRLLREAITTVCTEMKSLREEVVKLNSVIGEVNKRMDTVELRVTAVEEKLNAHATARAQDPAVTELIAQLKSELNDREQENLLNDIQIAGLPETSGAVLIL
ncbi:uncharacterized protein LOC121737529 [Aricia agestis]|uniref:uncharacterized protein LOC121737529 n=1 Tax=Aricia agestis TaxID=91739 RepID=UPI001C207400|nr:uncharacterized protein LOC121737529 [Aricia agestis]